ncbi:histidine triad nucleotide-binding protein [bacterium J17]|nr:histidine triad nucleotide-binding protein [bacterium J17]
MSGNDTIFHKIISKEIPSDIVFEDEQVIAIKDVNPAGPVHILCIPKKTIPKLADVEDGDKELLGHMLCTIRDIAKSQGLDEEGYRVVINNGAGGGQTVFQLHVHLIGGRDLSWPPG